MRGGYAAAAAIVFGVEVLIAVAVTDSFVRPHVGDSLAVILLYLALRAVPRIGVAAATGLALGIAVIVEAGQWLQVLVALGLERYALARVVLGTGFDPVDFLAYAAGALCVLGVECWRVSNQPRIAADR